MDCNKTNCMECKFGGQSDGCRFDEESYNQALEDALNVVEWDGYTLDIKERIEQLKK